MQGDVVVHVHYIIGKGVVVRLGHFPCVDQLGEDSGTAWREREVHRVVARRLSLLEARRSHCNYHVRMFCEGYMTTHSQII